MGGWWLSVNFNPPHLHFRLVEDPFEFCCDASTQPENAPKSLAAGLCPDLLGVRGLSLLRSARPIAGFKVDYFKGWAGLTEAILEGTEVAQRQRQRRWSVRARLRV